ncbi:hypothetical protein HNP84_000254 [Thermocatellispora tengchongensis]|uniref:Uncharacterized protein n=1 Tax=Thermocatellispora tengchongensis TaxID=1073253 RepID=A0A840NWK2_9ACTN|nr:hypothetical protein [Thermocatellispora tengchongensis]MBB5130566.1 hypothetical protein [Thermocatellispora tengchongensis]
MSKYSLAHPLYLDTQMMVSFLAFLDGGVAFETEAIDRTTKGREIKGEGGGKFKIPSIGSFFGGEANANLLASGKSEDSSEYKAARQHTNASLFNFLYSYLHDDEQIVTIDKPEHIDSLTPGQLVEISGRYVGNPLEDILAFIAQILPYLDEMSNGGKGATSSARRRSGNPAKRGTNQAPEQALESASSTQEELTKKLLIKMRQDLDESPVHDVLLETPSNIKAVLTVSSLYFDTTINEYLRAGEFTTLGKVTRVLGEGETINLTRRTVMGVTGSDEARQVILSMNNTGLNLGASDPIVNAPAVQILPMAIFV